MIFISGFRPNKFRNKRTTFGGRQYASKLESSVAADLELAKKATRKEERVVEVRPQYRVDLKVNGRHICNYYVDFYVKFADKHEELWEAKGFQTEVWRLKWKLLEAIWGKEHPEVILRIIR